ncbi:uncharacterized protein LOC129906864 [Episyrphus balteatus]|uniref:uncharacterized protein LOC129906864 n=1 Tax=Episyrphus balteatus TaxID=286459 RepID=UPI0024862543|nr:uncharacterized protein LOC129906864 [Episyrphus balteatus]
MSIDGSLTRQSENAIFVQLLSNYRNMFRRPTSRNELAKQEYSRNCLTMRFNEMCKTNLSVKQISRKLNNLKARLKEKNSKSLHGDKSLEFHDWEILFLNLWTGKSSSHWECNVDENEDADIDFHPEYKHNSSDKLITNSPNPILDPSDITEIKIEPDFRLSKDEDDIASVSDISGTPQWNIDNNPIELQSESKIINVSKEDVEYEKMSLEELERCVLISEAKMLKAQEDLSRAKEKISLYKLKILKRKHGIKDNKERTTMHQVRRFQEKRKGKPSLTTPSHIESQSPLV